MEAALASDRACQDAGFGAPDFAVTIRAAYLYITEVAYRVFGRGRARSCLGGSELWGGWGGWLGGLLALREGRSLPRGWVGCLPAWRDIMPGFSFLGAG